MGGTPVVVTQEDFLVTHRYMPYGAGEFLASDSFQTKDFYISGTVNVASDLGIIQQQ